MSTNPGIGTLRSNVGTLKNGTAIRIRNKGQRFWVTAERGGETVVLSTPKNLASTREGAERILSLLGGRA